MQGDFLDKQMVAARKTPIVTNDYEKFNDDYRSKIAHVLRPNEKLMEFVARTGLSKTRALEMSKLEITNFVEEAEEQNRESAYSPSAWKPKTFMPSHFTLED